MAIIYVPRLFGGTLIINTSPAPVIPDLGGGGGADPGQALFYMRQLQQSIKPPIPQPRMKKPYIPTKR